MPESWFAGLLSGGRSTFIHILCLTAYTIRVNERLDIANYLQQAQVQMQRLLLLSMAEAIPVDFGPVPSTTSNTW